MINPSISIIIPVYNAALYVEKAIFSALQQPEVLEVLVVNDGSTDGSDEILQSIASTTTRVTLLFHPQRINKGRSASRNLGLQHAIGTYIAFLDADDYYLENRFTNDMKLFAQNAACDGVYNAIGTDFYRDPVTDLEKKNELFTVRQRIAPDALFDALISGKHGHFSIDGLTVKKKVFGVAGLFNEELQVAEDTELLWKIAIKSRLESGILDSPVAMRGVHDDNVCDNIDLYKIYTMKMYESLLKWCSNNKVIYKIQDDLLKRIWIVKQKENNALCVDIKYWFVLFVPNSNLFFSMLSVKYFPFIRYRQKLFSFLYR
ncbi:glycosyltransferase family 2 protein [Flavobacterium sp. SOK18b]|uniref:glycosyltransferase family 2 protein n=1 Tax=Flavobacterium sp. SOK18b TaxID=797900 RepID=UPI0015F8A0D7|nr:glycosyltransferase family 2 protein [Flavobacterium sp. SOK18b]MBB1192501.1 glycosyltransferase family 2 protein [Flavobacterium sp. SOK18b]